jgi:hypothetical protein
MEEPTMTSPTLTPTSATGARTKLLPMVSAPPERLVTDDMLGEELPDLGANPAFVADFLSAVLTHERCGRHLYRSVAARSLNPVVAGRYEALGEETERHALLLEDVLLAVGGDPQYVSPAARATEAMDGRILESTYLLAGSMDLVTAELLMLDAVVLAETIDHANWTALAHVVLELPPGAVRDRFDRVVGEVLADEEEHLQWAHDTRLKMLALQASAEGMTAPGGRSEDLAARIRSWFC